MAWWILAAVAPFLVVLLTLLVLVRRRERARRRHDDDQATEAILTTERAKVAQELHDLVAHSVSVMTFGVGAGRLIMERDPDKARETLRVAENSGRQALADLQRLIPLLSSMTGSATSRTPQPSLSDLDTLLCAPVIHDGAPIRIPPALELTVYRVIEESLASTSRSSTVTLRWRVGHVEVVVAAPVATRTPSGPSVLRLRTRAGAFGGTFTIHQGGGLELRTRFPI
ncbi:histidine kinase [Nonomuraea sp. NBC_01738]|uniref:sensor histidine kinase n=1 Tax=Nonomuraea sp. NBC_01738 TaxID=2976003 RepID=UPI002E0D99AE|nr:histidine kinase [Nonomuraea sp. NBC_01738]